VRGVGGVHHARVLVRVRRVRRRLVRVVVVRVRGGGRRRGRGSGGARAVKLGRRRHNLKLDQENG